MSTITITDLEVYYRVGVPDSERAQPQRLLLTVELELDFSQAARTDDLSQTVDYFGVSQRLIGLGTGRQWKLIETLAADIGSLLLQELHMVDSVRVQVKKFIIPQARHVSVTLRSSREAV